MSFSITTNYVGKNAGIWITKALFQCETLDKGLVNIITNYKDSVTLNKGEALGTLIQADSGGWNASGNFNASGVTYDTVPYKVNVEGVITEWESHWESEKMKPGAHNSNVSADLQSFILDTITGTVSQSLEYSLWRSNWSGSTGYDLTGFYGFLYLLDNAPGINRVVGTTLTDANVATEIKKVYTGLTGLANYKENGGSKIYMNKQDVAMYKVAVGSASNEAYFTGDREANFLGVPLVGVPGMPRNVMVAGNMEEDIYFLTDLLSDTNEVRVKDMRDVDLTDYMRMKMRFRIGDGVPYGNKLILYK